MQNWLLLNSGRLYITLKVLRIADVLQRCCDESFFRAYACLYGGVNRSFRVNMPCGHAAGFFFFFRNGLFIAMVK